jgi:hypothetical protein
MEKRSEIRELVQRVIDLLGSPEIAIDDRHGPKLYSKFLKGLLAAPMAKLDPSSPGAPPKSHKSRPLQTPLPPHSEISFSVDHPSPSTTGSLSPAPREAALSFDTFAPVGAIDPFAPEFAGSPHALHITGAVDGTSMNMMSDFFQPSLPFDENILQSFQSLTDPSGWRDTTLPGTDYSATLHAKDLIPYLADSSWMTQFSQFQHNFDMDLSRQDHPMFTDTTQFMAGV